MPTERSRFFQFPWRSRAEIAGAVDAELRFHLEMRVQELIAAGAQPAAAARQAADEFGDLEFTRKYCQDADMQTDRAVRVADRFVALRQDVRYAWRALRGSPGFAAVSLITLALAIGANTAIFTVTRAVLLSPLPYGAPDQIMSVANSWPGHPWPAITTPLSPPDFVDYRAQQTRFTGLAAYTPRTMIWQPAASEPQVINTTLVSANMFDILEVRPLQGRAFVAGDDAAGAARKIVISYGFWQHELGGAPGIVGQSIVLDGASNQVIGVMPKSFTLWGNEDLWGPLDLTDDLANAAVTRKQHWVHALGRLKPGITTAAGTAELGAIAARLASSYPMADSARTAFVVPLHEVITGRIRPALLMLFGGAGLVLLIACANLANVALSRTAARRREIAVRAALGAGRGRIVRQLLIESLGVSLIGGAIGVGLANVATRLLLALNPEALPNIFVVGVDLRVLIFSLALSLATGIAFGLIPALDAGRTDLTSALRDGGRGSSGGRAGGRIRRMLVVAQVGLAVMLLIGAGLLIRSFRDLTHTPLGYEPSHVLTGEVRLSGTRFDSETVVNQFYDHALASLAHAPGVVAAGAASQLPTQGGANTSVRIDGVVNDEANLPDLGYIGVHGDYFQAMQIPLLAGRFYTAADDSSSPKVAIINQTAARQFFPKGDAVGRRIRIGPNPDAKWMTIIGVVGDIRDDALDVPTKPALYANHRQEAWETSLLFVVRTKGTPASATTALRSAITGADPAIPLRHILPLEEVIGSSLAARRFSLALITAFGAIALLLAAVGIYGVLAYAVTSRTREFGVRLALGASRQSILALVLRQGLGWSAIGLVIGLAGAAAGSQLLQGMLYGVHPLDPMTYVLVIAGLLAAVLLACLIPATRATRADPLHSMRAE